MERLGEYIYLQIRGCYDISDALSGDEEKKQHPRFAADYINRCKPTRTASLGIMPHPLEHCSVGWGWRIHWLPFCRGVIHPNVCSVHDNEQLELWGMRSITSLPSLPCPLCPGDVTPDRTLFIGQIELNWELMLNWIAWNRTVLTWKLGTYAKLNCLE